MKMIIEDILSEQEVVIPKKEDVEPLPLELGKKITTIEEARRWLTNPHNWFEGRIYILKWNGPIPTISRYHGEKLIREPHDDGILRAVVLEQRRLRNGGNKEVEQTGEET